MSRLGSVWIVVFSLGLMGFDSCSEEIHQYESSLCEGFNLSSVEGFSPQVLAGDYEGTFEQVYQEAQEASRGELSLSEFFDSHPDQVGYTRVFPVRGNRFRTRSDGEFLLCQIRNNWFVESVPSQPGENYRLLHLQGQGSVLRLTPLYFDASQLSGSEELLLYKKTFSDDRERRTVPVVGNRGVRRERVISYLKQAEDGRALIMKEDQSD